MVSNFLFITSLNFLTTLKKSLRKKKLELKDWKKFLLVD